MNYVFRLKNKWASRVRQYGLITTIRKLANALVRPIRRKDNQLILAVAPHKSKSFRDVQIRNLTNEDVTDYAIRGELTERQRARMSDFLADGCRGFLAETDGHLAGYAFVQLAGTYVFGGDGRLLIPDGMMILKNLIVFPDFRGNSLGKKLNQVRIASIPESSIPIVFVIPENRFAIRNLKMFDFEEIMIFSRTIWFVRWVRKRVKLLSDCDVSHQLMGALNGEDGT